MSIMIKNMMPFSWVFFFKMTRKNVISHDFKHCSPFLAPNCFWYVLKLPLVMVVKNKENERDENTAGKVTIEPEVDIRTSKYLTTPLGLLEHSTYPVVDILSFLVFSLLILTHYTTQ